MIPAGHIALWRSPVNAITRIRPPAIADDGCDGVSITELLQARGIIRVGQHGALWNVYLTGDRFAIGETVEDALDSIGASA
jgi:hypothetical protein